METTETPETTETTLVQKALQFQDTRDDIKFMQEIAELKPAVAVQDLFDEIESLTENCAMTRKEVYDVLGEQLQDIYAYEKDTNPRVAIAYQEVQNELLRIFMLKLDYIGVHEKIRSKLHLINTSLGTIEQHSICEIDDSFLFGYYYSILDTLLDYEEWGYADEETSPSGDDK